MTKDNPQHYKQGSTEVWDFISENDLCYFKGNIIKYIVRAGKKSFEPELDDLKKAKAYLDKLITLKESESRTTSDRIQELYDAAPFMFDAEDTCTANPFDR